MNSQQFVLGGVANGCTCDNPADLFFHSKNNCEYLSYVVWNNENFVGNRDFDVPQSLMLGDSNLPFDGNLTRWEELKNQVSSPKSSANAGCFSPQ